MNIQSLCPYGMKSIMECISRATLLSQPTDIPGFLLQYLSELISFRESFPEDDPKIVTFCYQEMWENKFLKTTVNPITTTKTSPEVPSQTELKEALKTLYSDLVSSGEQKKLNPLGKDKYPSATPTFVKPAPPHCVGRKVGKNVAPPVLVVKGEEKPAPPPCVERKFGKNVAPPVLVKGEEKPAPPPCVERKFGKNVAPPVLVKGEEKPVPPPCVERKFWKNVAPPVLVKGEEKPVPPPCVERKFGKNVAPPVLVVKGEDNPAPLPCVERKFGKKVAPPVLVVKGEEKPAPPPCVERKFGKNVAPPVLVVKGEDNPAPLPCVERKFGKKVAPPVLVVKGEEKPAPPPCVKRKFGKNVAPPVLVVKGEEKPAPPPCVKRKFGKNVAPPVLVVKGEEKPAPPPCVKRKFGKNVAPPVLVVKGEEKPAPPPRNINMKTRRVSISRVPSPPQSEATTDDIMKTPGTLELKTIHKKSPTPKASTSSATSDPSKLPNIPISKLTQSLVIPSKKTIGSLSLENREVVPERRALGPLKRAPKLEAGRVPNTERAKIRPTTPKFQQPEEWNLSNRLPEKKRILWTNREKVKPVAERKVQGAAFTRLASVVVSTNKCNLAPTHTCPHLAPACIIRYKRMQIRALPFGHNSPH
ncbi:titin-like [Sander lucioperca]|uniref:titin-like n=1 Tax=Sander lucioperca TaxID=283035 RepID=UPI00125D9D96|nr:titin-like [Sander lucioperca]